jgi:hypothetical protein
LGRNFVKRFAFSLHGWLDLFYNEQTEKEFAIMLLPGNHEVRVNSMINLFGRSNPGG